MLEVRFQALGQGVAGERDDALILLALLGNDGDHHVAVADQGTDIALAPVLTITVAGHRTQLALIGAFGQQQGYRAMALGLQGKAPLELEGAGQQGHGGHGFTDQPLHGQWVVVPFNNPADAAF